MQVIEAKFQTLKDLIFQLNESTKAISSNRIIFFKGNNSIISFRDAELTFNQLISWLYILFYECGKVNVRFFTMRMETTKSLPSEEVNNVPKLTHAYRTILQHNMTDTAEDAAKRSFCEEWTMNCVQKAVPSNLEDWYVCCNKLLDNSTSLIESFIACLQEIRGNDFSDVVIEQWLGEEARNVIPYEYEKIAQIVFNEYGFDQLLDPHLFVKKNFSKWQIELKGAPDGFHFEEVARRYIEAELATKDFIPINGNDLLAIGIPKMKLHHYLMLARDSFYGSPCPKGTLLERINTTYALE